MPSLFLLVPSNWTSGAIFSLSLLVLKVIVDGSFWGSGFPPYSTFSVTNPSR